MQAGAQGLSQPPTPTGRALADDEIEYRVSGNVPISNTSEDDRPDGARLDNRRRQLLNHPIDDLERRYRVADRDAVLAETDSRQLRRAHHQDYSV